MMHSKWFILPCSKKNIQLSGTLDGGQSFRWKKITNGCTNEWIGVFSNRVWILKQTEIAIEFQVIERLQTQNTEKYYGQILRDYFQIDLNLQEHYAMWCKDPFFKKAASQFYGIRILKQDLVENIFSFICSSNNNISRISSMVEKLAKLYGDKICEINGQHFYAFPTIEQLSDVQNVLEATLKGEGFGYRARYIAATVNTINSKGSDQWLQNLRTMTYDDARLELMKLPGVGPKVADCICLMSLGHLNAIPVDTHVYQIARKFYMPGLPKQKTVTTALHKQIGDHFRKIYGPLAGWAHTVS